MPSQQEPVAAAAGQDLRPWLGRIATRRFDVTAEMIAAFAEFSGDHSPIHVDRAAARRRGLKDCVMHGALQASLVSCVLGMDLPGPCGMLQQLALQFRRPCYAGDTLTVSVAVDEVFESVGALRMSVRIVNQNDQLVTTGKAQSGVVEA